MSEIKKCPFCGGENLGTRVYYDDEAKFIIGFRPECECGAKGKMFDTHIDQNMETKEFGYKFKEMIDTSINWMNNADKSEWLW